MGGKEWIRSYRVWLTALILFTLAGGWYIWRMVVDRTLNSIVFLSIYVWIIVFNYSRIKMMRDTARKNYEDYYNQMKREIVGSL